MFIKDYLTDIYKASKSLLVGMKRTGYYFVHPKEIITEQYPDNRATLQMGIGAIPDATLACLTDREDIGIHTEMFSDGLLHLANLSLGPLDVTFFELAGLVAVALHLAGIGAARRSYARR